MSRFEHFLLVCNNAGKDGDTKARCGKQGADDLLGRLRALVVSKRDKGRVRILRSGCLDFCAKGCAAVAFSGQRGADQEVKETWYTHLAPEDAEDLYAAHIERGETYTPIARKKEKESP